MKRFISHQSSLEHWRRRRRLPRDSYNRRRNDVLPDKQSSIDSLVFSGFELPVHILIKNPNDRRVSTIVRQHVFRADTPIGSFMNIGNGFLVSSPEFCFLQMAHDLDLIELIELGYELCGEYSLPVASDKPEKGFYERKALTSTKKLRLFLDEMKDAKGLLKAKRSLRFVLDNSASPMETKLAMFLTLPYMLGGYGFEPPELNYHITLTQKAKKYFSKGYYSCDLFWPEANVAVEYDSDYFHTGSDRIADDSKRRNALASIGIRVITVTRQQLYSSVELERVARVLASHLDKRLFSKESNFSTAHLELCKQLLKR